MFSDDNVAVLARNTSTASVFGGAVALSFGASGGGGSLVTSEITGNTEAYISGATTKVDARGTNANMSVNNGTMVNPFSLGPAAPTDDRSGYEREREAVRGPLGQRQLASGGRHHRRQRRRERPAFRS